MLFRKKLIEVEAVHLEDNIADMTEVLKFVRGTKVELTIGGMIIYNTLGVPMLAEFGDWIVREVNGELYPCKPDIFEKTYEQVGD